MEKTTVQLTKAARDRLQAAKYYYRHRNVSQTIDALIDCAEAKRKKSEDENEDKTTE